MQRVSCGQGRRDRTRTLNFYQFYLYGQLLQVASFALLLINDALLPLIHPVEIVAPPQLA